MDTYFLTFADSLISQPSTVYLNLEGYKAGVYAVKLSTYPSSDILSLRAVYVNNYGQSQTLYSIPVNTSGSIMEYHLPPTIGDYSHAKLVLTSMNSPVRVASISCEECAIADLPQNDFVFHAHLGYQRFAPENTVPGFECAGKSGFKACITNPISSSDGVLYCYHEDHKLLTKDNGNTYISLTAKEFQSMPSDSIEVYDAGMKFSKSYKGVKIAKLDDFFRVCKNTV